VGGALYANRWHRAVRRFVRRHVDELRRVPVWFFSSGPLDDSADRTLIPPVPEVTVLMERVGALAHATFGGRLPEDAKGFPASAMAKKRHGDYRNRERIADWAEQLAEQLPHARPGVAIDHPGYALWRRAFYGVLGWSLCAASMFALQRVLSLTTALALHAVAAPLIFALLSWRYFRARGARAPLSTALFFTGLVALLDLTVVAQGLLHSLVMLTSIVGTWLPLALIFLVTWCTGTIMAMGPLSKAPEVGAPGEASAGVR
jgi:hypothetical protein